ncbi:hypothetical protein N7454_009394 [Penicillium verhagenii]|nr:hypothetical protein N7454_009394 [Penicillium verhagenii]
MPPAAIAYSDATIPAHEDVLWQVMKTQLTLQTPGIAPSPLRVSVMLTTHLFMVLKTFNYAIERILANNRISIRMLLLHSSIGHVQ